METVFAWPGVGRLAYEGIIFRDFAVVQTVVIYGGTIVIGVNLFIDFIYAYLNPQIRYR